MQLFANNADSSLNGAIASDTTSIILKAGDGTKFPSPSGEDFFLITLFQRVGTTELNHEIVTCTARAGDTLTVIRAQEGTVARAFNSGDLVELRFTKGGADNFVQKVASKGLSTEDYTTAEKSKLSGIAAGANNYSHPTGDGNQHVPATGTTNNGKVLKAGSTAGSAAWGNVAYSEVTGKPTLGTAADKNVAATGDASTTQVVLGSDTRLSNARPASDVSAWAKAATKPTYTKSEVGLGNVDNTSDTNKPVSTATQTALDTKANLASPSFIGNVVAESSQASVGISGLLGNNSGFESKAQGSGGTAGAATIAFHRPAAHAVHFGIDTDNKLKVGGWSLGANAYAIYHEGNDGAGSGLDADLLDGQQGSFYQNASNLTTGTVPEPRLPALPISKVTGLQTALDAKASNVTSYVNVSGTTTASAFSRYRLTASLDLTLPSNPSDGDWVDVVNHSGTKTARVLRNGQNINNLAEDMTLDLLWAPVRFVFRTGYGWFIA